MDFLEFLDDEVLRMLMLTKEELEEILIKYFIENLDYVNLKTSTKEQIKAFKKRCKNKYKDKYKE